MYRDADSGNTADVWGSWNAREYLEEYFGKFSADVRTTTKFVTTELSKLKDTPLSRVLDFGSGPTIIGIAGTVPYVREIHIADYLDSNLNEIRSWLENEPNSFDFTDTVSFTLELEGIDPSAATIRRRSEELKSRIVKVLRCDAGSITPLGRDADTYPLIISLYCADSATSSKRMWQIYMKNILSLLEPGGTIIVSALRKCEFYTIGPNRFPSANIDESDLRDVFLANGFSNSNIAIKVVDVPGEVEQGFTSLLLARAQKDA